MARRHHDFATARIAGLAFLVIASNALGAAGCDSIASGSVTVESVGPPQLISGASGAWVLHAPTLSLDCSPPRACYAKTQRIQYDFSCAPRYTVMTERVSMDLDGTIVKHEVLEAAPRYTPACGAGAGQVLDTYCGPLFDRD